MRNHLGGEKTVIKSSKGEKKIEELFRKNGISYVREINF